MRKTSYYTRLEYFKSLNIESNENYECVNNDGTTNIDCTITNVAAIRKENRTNFVFDMKKCK